MPSERILVTGAGGFIGGRAVEVLHLSGRGDVRAVVRRWSTAARIGRLPVEIVRADVTEPAQMRSVMEGMSAVLHCARADGRVNVEGTRQVMEAALAAGVRRVVHLSTIEVYGVVAGDIREDAPLRKEGREYGDSKIGAEEVCRDYAARGLNILVLRPTVVYGPYSDLWTVEFAERFLSGHFLPEAACRGVCNLVYVDDVVGAMMTALDSDAGSGEAFNINGPDRVTWNDYFDALNAALGLPSLSRLSASGARATATLMQPVRMVAKAALRHFQEPIMALYQRSDLAKQLMKSAEHAIRSSPTPAELSLYSRQGYYVGAKAESQLGYRGAFDMAAGVRLSADWLHDFRYA